MKSPCNPKVLLWNNDGRPSPRSKIFFYNRDTDIPKSVKYVESGTLTNEITADSSGDFPQVELLDGEYTLRGYTPLDPKEPYPEFPLDYELRDTWDLSGEETSSGEEIETPATAEDLQALREYDGDAEKVWVGNKLFIKDTLVSQTDNNGTIVVSSALTDVVWRMDLTGYDTTSLDWFGADKSGATDSTAAIISAISAIYTNTSGPAQYRLPGTLYIPNGTYLVNSDITFTCPVIMESNTRFYNNTGSQVDLKFNKGLETDKTDLFYFVGAGLSPVVPKFPQRLPNGKVQTVSLQWYPSDYVEISWFPYEVSFVGEGTINTADNTQHTIKSVKGSGDIVFLTTAGKPPCIVKEFSCAPMGLEVQGTGTVYFDTLNTTYMKTASDINRCEGAELIIGKNWTIDFDATFKFSSVHGNKTSLTISNNSGTSHTIGATGDVDFESFTWVLHDLIPTFKTEPKNLDWTGADSDDWNNYLVYGSSNFTGTTTSGDISLNAYYKFTGLNHTGTFQCIGVGSAMALENCTIHLSSGKTLWASELKVDNCNILTDDPDNGSLSSSNMRLHDSYIQCGVYLSSFANPMQMTMERCRFTNTISFADNGVLQTLVARNNELALCNFIHYHISVGSLTGDAKVTVDVSDNWTTDLTGQLVCTKGMAKVHGVWTSVGGSSKWIQPFEALGILDIRSSSTGRTLMDTQSIFTPYIVSSWENDPSVVALDSGVAAFWVQGGSERNIIFDVGNTQNRNA